MGHQWIIDVIVDLKTFAQQNDLPALANELALAADIAEAEIDPDNEGVPLAVRCGQSESRRFLSQA
jgi:hypothetical protein